MNRMINTALEKGDVLEQLRRIRKRVDVIEQEDMSLSELIEYWNGQHKQARDMIDWLVTEYRGITDNESR